MISTIGATVITASIGTALREWQDQFAMIDFVTKGSNPFTEHYSVVRADVVDPNDPSTDINTSFIRRLQEADNILVALVKLFRIVLQILFEILLLNLVLNIPRKLFFLKIV